MTEWISVKDRLPQHNNMVLTWFDPAPDCSSHYQAANGRWLRGHVKGVKPSWMTHWMEMPKPPKGKKGK